MSKTLISIDKKRLKIIKKQVDRIIKELEKREAKAREVR